MKQKQKTKVNRKTRNRNSEKRKLQKTGARAEMKNIVTKKVKNIIAWRAAIHIVPASQMRTEYDAWSVRNRRTKNALSNMTYVRRNCKTE